MLGLFLDMLYMAVCPTKHKRTSSRPEQDLNVCTVLCIKPLSDLTHENSWIGRCPAGARPNPYAASG